MIVYDEIGDAITEAAWRLILGSNKSPLKFVENEANNMKGSDGLAYPSIAAFAALGDMLQYFRSPNVIPVHRSAGWRQKRRRKLERQTGRR